MRPQKIGLIALLAVLTTLTIDKVPLIQNPKSKIQHSQVLAQTPEARKAEANRLKQQGIDQAQTRQFEAAFQSWQQALVIYREIKDRQGEGRVLNNLGLGYYLLSDYAKAVDYHQQSLAIAKRCCEAQIAKDVKDQEGEGKALGNLGNVYYYLGTTPKRLIIIDSIWRLPRRSKTAKGSGRLSAIWEMITKP
jgi:tetratricopeptide (TPR) repeat protein